MASFLRQFSALLFILSQGMFSYGFNMHRYHKKKTELWVRHNTSTLIFKLNFTNSFKFFSIGYKIFLSFYLLRMLMELISKCWWFPNGLLFKMLLLLVALVDVAWLGHTGVISSFTGLILSRERYDQSRQHIKKQRQYFANKCLSSQGYGFSSGHVGMWELDYKESWVPKNWCFWTLVLEKTLESPLDCKEIQPVHPKGNQFWIFVKRTDAEAETPILWSLDAKNWLIWKDPDAGKDWRREEKGTTQDEMVG